MADDASHCLDLVQSERIDAAHTVCRNLDLDDPGEAQVFAHYQQYGVIGRARLREIALRGIDTATASERQTLEESREHLLFAAESGMRWAPMLLAMTIAMFEPPEIDVETGIVTYSEDQTYWFGKAAELGWPEANYQLGIRALSDSGTMLIQPEYMPYLERAAELDHAEAVALLRKYESATAAAESAAVDDPDLLREHAIELITHPDGDREAGIRLMKTLADAGDEEAMLMVGKWAWHEEDPAASREYLEKAASAGNADAMMALGNWHACNGNADEAGRWFEEATANKHPEARYASRDLAEWGIDEWECRFL